LYFSLYFFLFSCYFDLLLCVFSNYSASGLQICYNKVELIQVTLCEQKLSQVKSQNSLDYPYVAFQYLMSPTTETKRILPGAFHTFITAHRPGLLLTYYDAGLSIVSAITFSHIIQSLSP